MTTRLERIAAITILCGAAWAALASAVGAGSAAAPSVLRGTLITLDEAKGTSRTEGSLIGIWQLTSVAPIFQDNSQFGAKGMETFTGCHDRNGNEKCEASENGTLRSRERP